MSKCLDNSVACSADIFLLPFAIDRIDGSLSPIFSAINLRASFLVDAGMDSISDFKSVIFFMTKRYIMYLYLSKNNTNCVVAYIDTFCIMPL